MEWYPEQPSLATSTPILDDISLFVDAIKFLLDESDITTITPNTGTVPYEESRDGDVSQDPRDRQSEMIETIQTLQSTNPEGDFMIMELTRSSTTTLDAQYGGLNTRQARKDNKVRRRRSSASSRVVSSATSFCSTSHFTNNGTNPVAETAGLLVDTPAFKAISAARTSIRTDYFRFLEINLGRWAQGGLWQTSGPLDQTAGMNMYDSLQVLYLRVCRLDMRIRDDAIRSRVALVLLHLKYEETCRQWNARASRYPKPTSRVGRGSISSIIDSILENAHPEWTTANSRQKAELRAKFHDQKRFGKRWWMLVDVLGPSILILCSSRFAGTINNTTVTTDMIKAIIRAIQNSKTALMAVLETVNPIADSLLRNQEYGSQDVDQLLKSLRSVRLDWVGGEDDLT
ncbi:hypothetical protein H634G_08418 [Metarhizium anisopliae BRIP 53293]|uniref:Aurovertin biosynthesis cluster transcription factor aurF n=1 Tax=Metarhizium anisopliae BRIP 53293 TaxID=1291518 RepID=A0A0D9NR81_METAN|nr:hypothetical protein H634G_08418 [Metarhizium anisopliae BRIP 53293]KJK94989.1 hypothetical protein H633G_01137 [Metarhizium anisopliae BRIP 53284]